MAANFPVNANKQSIFGHSMGGHGALTIAMKDPVSAAQQNTTPPRSATSRPVL